MKSTIKKKTVLIVEDSPGFSELMKFIIEDEGYRGVMFPLEQNFMSWVEKEEPDVIIMDIALNRLNGFDLIHDLKQNAKHRHTQVIVITGRDLSVKDITDLKVHEIPYLRKGRVDIQDIHKAVREAVERAEKTHAKKK